MNPRHTVLLVEDDEATRERLAQAIAANPQLQLVAAAGNCSEARAALERKMPDALLVDLGLPDGRGADLIREACARSPELPCMVITGFGDEAHVLEAVRAGACSYLLKDASERTIGKSILEMMAGGSPISSAVARHVLNGLRTRDADPPVPSAAAAPAPEFTGREVEVLEQVAKGYAYGEIAQGLGVSVNTVREYIRQIYRKLAVHSRSEAVYEAQMLGVLGAPTSGQ